MEAQQNEVEEEKKPEEKAEDAQVCEVEQPVKTPMMVKETVIKVCRGDYIFKFSRLVYFLTPTHSLKWRGENKKTEGSILIR